MMTPVTTHMTRENLALSVISVFFIYVVLVGALFLTRMEYGWDTTVYCDAVAAHDVGKNPYITSNLENTDFPFSYQPVFLDVFSIPCSYRLLYEKYYPLLYLVLVITMPLYWSRSWNKHELLTATALVLTGFAGFQWNVLTGNVGIYELIILSVVFGLMKTNKVVAAAYVLGVLSSWKLFPIILLLPFSAYPGTWRNRFTLLLSGIAGFISVFAISAILYPELLIYFLHSITGGIHGQHSTIYEFGGGKYNTNLIIFIRILLNRIFMISTWLPTLSIYVTIVTIFLLTSYKLTKRIYATDKYGNNNFIVVYSMWTLVLLFIMPRIMPYTVILATLPLFILLFTANTYSLWSRLFIFIIACLPSLTIYFPHTHHVALRNSQLISLFVIIVYTQIVIWKNTFSNNLIASNQ